MSRNDLALWRGVFDNLKEVAGCTPQCRAAIKREVAMGSEVSIQTIDHSETRREQ